MPISHGKPQQQNGSQGAQNGKLGDKVDELYPTDNNKR